MVYFLNKTTNQIFIFLENRFFDKFCLKFCRYFCFFMYGSFSSWLIILAYFAGKVCLIFFHFFIHASFDTISQFRGIVIAVVVKQNFVTSLVRTSFVRISSGVWLWCGVRKKIGLTFLWIKIRTMIKKNIFLCLTSRVFLSQGEALIILSYFW